MPFTYYLYHVPTGKKRKSHSEESKRKMSLNKKGKKLGPLSIETRQKMSIAHRGIKRKPHSPETKEKMRIAMKLAWKEGRLHGTPRRKN